MRRIPFISNLLRFAEGLRFRQLFLLTGALLLIDLVLPDPIPLLDELLLGLLTLLFSSLRKPKRKALETDQKSGT